MTASARARKLFAAVDDEGEGRAVGRRHGSPHGLVDGGSDRFPRLLQLSQRGAGRGRGGSSRIRVPIFEHPQPMSELVGGGVQIVQALHVATRHPGSIQRKPLRQHALPSGEVHHRRVRPMSVQAVKQEGRVDGRQPNDQKRYEAELRKGSGFRPELHGSSLPTDVNQIGNRCDTCPRRSCTASTGLDLAGCHRTYGRVASWIDPMKGRFKVTISGFRKPVTRTKDERSGPSS